MRLVAFVEPKRFLLLYAGTREMKPTWDSLLQYEVPEWYRDAKFGIWGNSLLRVLNCPQRCPDNMCAVKGRETQGGREITKNKDLADCWDEMRWGESKEWWPGTV